MQHRTVFIAFSFLVPLLLGGANVVFGQGIKGAVNVHCFRSASQPPPLIDGKTDKERWQKFVSVQPSLIGMTFDKVEKALGDGKSNDEHSFLSYAITRNDGPHKPGDLAFIECTLMFEKGVVESYRVDPVRWNN